MPALHSRSLRTHRGESAPVPHRAWECLAVPSPEGEMPWVRLWPCSPFVACKGENTEECRFADKTNTDKTYAMNASPFLLPLSFRQGFLVVAGAPSSANT